MVHKRWRRWRREMRAREEGIVLEVSRVEGLIKQ
jgi:hypothetical protein